MIRGSTITFRATCLDADGAPLLPTEATLYLVYAPADGSHTRARETIPLVVNGNVASCQWDSSVASAAMPVSWHVRAGSPGAEAVAQDGSFRMEASEANPAF